MSTSLEVKYTVQPEYTIHPPVVSPLASNPVVVRLLPGRGPPPVIQGVKSSLPGVTTRVIDSHTFEVVVESPRPDLAGHYLLVQTAGAPLEWPVVPFARGNESKQ